jgi:hypothetical protein
LRGKICGPKIVNGGDTNFELKRESGYPNVINVVKIAPYAGHMIRRPEDLPPNAATKGKSKPRWADKGEQL